MNSLGIAVALIAMAVGVLDAEVLSLEAKEHSLLIDKPLYRRQNGERCYWTCPNGETYPYGNSTQPPFPTNTPPGPGEPNFGYLIYITIEIEFNLGCIYDVRNHVYHFVYSVSGGLVILTTENYIRWGITHVRGNNISNQCFTYDITNEIYVLIVRTSSEYSWFQSIDRGERWTLQPYHITGFTGGIVSVVWHSQESTWCTISGGYIQYSTDLRTWTRRETFTLGNGFLVHELYSIVVSGSQNLVWVVIAKQVSSDNTTRLVYFVGTLVSGRYTVTSGPYDYDYSGSVTYIRVASDGVSLTTWRLVTKVVSIYFQDSNLNNVISIPCNSTVVEWNGQYRVRQIPVPIYVSGQRHYTISQGHVIHSGDNPLSGYHGRSFRFSVTLSASISVTKVYFRFLWSGSLYGEYGYDFNAGGFYLDITRTVDGSCEGSQQVYRVPFALTSRLVNLYIIVDVRTIQTYGNFGDVVLSSYAVAQSYQNRLALSCEGGDVTVQSGELIVYSSEY